MSETDPAAGAERPQSPLSEAVEQAAAAASMWARDLTRFARHQADLLAVGNYGVNDLTTAQVGLLRIWVTNSVRTAGVLSDNLALLAYGTAGAPPPRSFGVGIDVPAGAELRLTASDLKGQILGHRIPSSKVRLAPNAVAAQAGAAKLAIEITVECAGVPGDIYAGELSSGDGAVTVPFRVAIDELGGPVP
jgi:hypothetical protein